MKTKTRLRLSRRPKEPRSLSAGVGIVALALTLLTGLAVMMPWRDTGEVRAQTLPPGASTWIVRHTYDALNRVETATDPNGGVYRFTYDANSNRESLTYPNGTKTTYAYNSLNRLTGLTTVHEPSGRMIQSYVYELAPAGHRTRITEQDGIVREYEYDNIYELTKEAVRGSGTDYSRTFGYDAVGNRLSQTTVGYGAGTTTYGYDARDRLVTENGVPWLWDASGNLTQRPDGVRFVWDYENRLTAVERPDGTVVTHAYDADGELVSSRVTRPDQVAVATKYVVDPSGVYSQVITEQAGDGLTAFYVRGGDELLAVIRPSGMRYIHADHLGSTRRITDENGFITDGYAYSAFGEVIAHTGDDPLKYQFAGQPFDAETGLYYNRARWMDPSTGRFLSMDPWDGDPFRPITLHKYLYANADPVNNVDPTGSQSLGMTMVSVSINVSLNAFSSFNPAAPITSVATALLTGTAETFIPGRVPARVLQTAWRYAKPIGGIFKFGEAALVGFKSPIASYKLLLDLKRGQGAALQAHHILEQRHLKAWGYALSELDNAPAQILTQAEHTMISQRLLQSLPTLPPGKSYTKAQVWQKYQEVYAEYPGYLQAIAHYFD